MIGIGLTPEGTLQNDVIYEFMMEHLWRTEPANLTEWSVSNLYLSWREGNVFNLSVLFMKGEGEPSSNHGVGTDSMIHETRPPLKSLGPWSGPSIPGPSIPDPSIPDPS